MNTMRLRFGIVICLSIIALASSAQAGKPAKQPPPKATPAPTASPDAPPSIQLEVFLDGYLDRILAPAGEKGLKHPEFITNLRVAIGNLMQKAPASSQPAYQAALAVCYALSHAVDERQKMESQGGTWNQRAAGLRKDIMQLYAHERELEQQSGPTAAAPAASAAPISPEPVRVAAPTPPQKPSSILSQIYSAPDPYSVLTSGDAAQRQSTQQKINNAKQQLLDLAAKEPSYIPEAFKTGVDICDKFVAAFDQQNRNKLFIAQTKNEQGLISQNENGWQIQWAQKVDRLRQEIRVLDQRVRELER